MRVGAARSMPAGFVLLVILARRLHYISSTPET
jgi:hypothetical protein